MFVHVLLALISSAFAGGGDPVIHAETAYKAGLQMQYTVLSDQIAEVDSGAYDAPPTVQPEHAENCSRLRTRYEHHTSIALRAQASLESVPTNLELQLTRDYVADLERTRDRHAEMAATAEREILALPLVEQQEAPDIEELRASRALVASELRRIGAEIPLSRHAHREGPNVRLTVPDPFEPVPEVNVVIPSTFPACSSPAS